MYMCAGMKLMAQDKGGASKGGFLNSNSFS